MVRKLTNVSFVRLGMVILDEIQRIVISGTITGGTFKLLFAISVNGVTVTQSTWDIDWSSDVTATANNIEEALNALTYLDSVSVTGIAISATRYRFDVLFTGQDGSRSHNVLGLSANNLTGTDISFTFRKTRDGSPINAVAQNTMNDTVSPANIIFNQTDYLINGRLLPKDYFSFWLRRRLLSPTAVPSGTDIIDNCDVTVNYFVG